MKVFRARLNAIGFHFGRFSRIILGCALALLPVSGSLSAGNSGLFEKLPRGDVNIPSFTLPYSAYASPEARAYFSDHVRDVHPVFGADILSARKYYDRWNAEQVRAALKIYKVLIRHEIIDGVPVDVVIPGAGVGIRNRDRVLINLHGGAFAWGAHFGGLAESIPVSALGHIKVVTVDYREGPENHFPAASVDVAKVYKVLLKRYRPANVGIYGCSAGGILTAESVAWFQAHHLPAPGAIALMCSGAGDADGDSSYLGPVLVGDRPVRMADERLSAAKLPYFRGAKLSDPLVAPIVSDAVLRKFPPTLIVSATRDFMFSSAMETANKLSALGVSVELRVWDGLWHGFMVVPGLPESREAYATVATFFGRRLGRKERNAHHR